MLWYGVSGVLRRRAEVLGLSRVPRTNRSRRGNVETWGLRLRSGSWKGGDWLLSMAGSLS